MKLAVGSLRALRQLREDERGQLMPLILFLAIAFYTSVGMVVNSGRVTREKVAAQNAIDAAAVSGANALARGMNYLASNNITQAKLLASIVVVRAFAPAIRDAKATAKAVLATARGMVATGNTLKASLHPATAAIGWAMWAAGRAMEVKISKPHIGELALLERLDGALGRRSSFRRKWAAEPRGLAWRAVKALTKIADEIAKTAPFIAQVSCRAIYERNMQRYGGQGAWLLPLYPSLPVCKGKFADFVAPARRATQQFAEWVYDKARFALVLSLFNRHYARHVSNEFNRLFTGRSTIKKFRDKDLEAVQKKQKEAEKTAAEATREHRRKDDLERRLDDLYRRQADGENVGAAIRSTQRAIRRSEQRLARLEERGKRQSQEAQRLMERRLRGDRGRQPAKLGRLKGPVRNRKDIYPYLLDGSGYPATFTVFAIGYRGAQETMAGSQFRHPNPDGGVYAAARVYNSVRADLWTPGWRAKLVGADAKLLRKRPGVEPGPCGGRGRRVSSAKVGLHVGAFPPSESRLSSSMRRMLNRLSHH
jgi:hypothetical protein